MFTDFTERIKLVWHICSMQVLEHTYLIIFMPYYTHWAETVVGVSITIVVVKVEQTCIGTIVIVASTFENRVVRVHKVRIIQFYSYLFLYKVPFYASLKACIKYRIIYFFVFFILASLFMCNSHFRYHITLLHTLGGNRGWCKHHHCRSKSRTNPHRNHCNSRPHVRKQGRSSSQRPNNLKTKNLN